MSECARFQNWMVEALYAELDEERRADFERHITGCAECAALYGELRVTSELMQLRRRPDPGAEYWDAFWPRLEERVAREDSAAADAFRTGGRRSLGSWGWRVAVAAVVLVAGIWMGRSVFAPSPDVAGDAPDPRESVARIDSTSPGAPSSDDGGSVAVETQPAPIDAPPSPPRLPDATVRQADPGEAVLASSRDDALRYIGRSQVVLLAILNADAGDAAPASLAPYREHAGELVREAAAIRDDLDGAENRRLRELISQLELILREIAHLEAGNDLESVDVIRDRVDRQGMLLRINLEQMRDGEPSSATHRNDAID